VIAAALAVVRDVALAELVSKLLVVEDSSVEEQEFEECARRVERHGQRQRIEHLKTEIAKGSVLPTDQRYAEYLRLERELRGPVGKGDG